MAAQAQIVGAEDSHNYKLTIPSISVQRKSSVLILQKNRRGRGVPRNGIEKSRTKHVANIIALH